MSNQNNTPTLLVINAGSSSVKFKLFKADSFLSLLCEGAVTGIGSAPVWDMDGEKPPLPEDTSQEKAITRILETIAARPDESLQAVGHRVVHGGTAFTAPVLVDRTVIETLETLTELAPLHQPHNIGAIKAVEKRHPDLPQVACFDTAFHSDLAPVHSLFALPHEWAARGVRRYGFHGLSYEWLARKLKEDRHGWAEGRIIAAHLGNGASMCAINGGKSVATTMGMTALDGLPMGTRCGAIDAGALIYLQESAGLSLDDLNTLLYKESGLKGLSGRSNDMRALRKAAAKGHQDAQLAIDYFTEKVVQFTAQLSATIGGIDALVFTGGIGENDEILRQDVARRLSYLGEFTVHTEPANEERMIATHAKTLIA